jgi:hypothetical protein
MCVAFMYAYRVFWSLCKIMLLIVGSYIGR